MLFTLLVCCLLFVVCFNVVVLDFSFCMCSKRAGDIKVLEAASITVFRFDCVSMNSNCSPAKSIGFYRTDLLADTISCFDWNPTTPYSTIVSGFPFFLIFPLVFCGFIMTCVIGSCSVRSLTLCRAGQWGNRLLEFGYCWHKSQALRKWNRASSSLFLVSKTMFMCKLPDLFFFGTQYESQQFSCRFGKQVDAVNPVLVTEPLLATSFTSSILGTVLTIQTLLLAVF